MANIKPPKYVRQVLFALQGRGYPTYLVGGCVRDMLMGVRPQDWDVCTAALPAEIMEIFPNSRPTGLKHGTVTVVLDSHTVEVTTFRSDGSYADHRHPDMVQFVSDLTADLSRRDFTMNAIALSPEGLLADPFGGAEDIRRQIIRCVGDPAQRFEEDALRMFRALRFSARLGFSIELFTMEGIRAKAPLAACLAAERVRDEVEKLLLTRAPETLFSLVWLGLLTNYLSPGMPDPALLQKLDKLPRKAQARWAGLCHVLLQSGCIGSAEDFLTALRLDHRTVRLAADCERLLSLPVPASDLERKRWLKRYGVDAVRCALACRDAFFDTNESRELRRVLRSGECFSLRDLAVTGDDLLALGLRGRALGDMLDFLLDYVMEYPDNNRRELLLALASGGEE